MPDTAAFRAAEELWRLAKSIMAFVECEEGQCPDCELLRAIAAEVLDIKRKMRESGSRGAGANA